MKSAGDCAGAVGALLANGDRTALIRVVTMRDTGSAGVGVMTVDAGGGGAIAGAAADEATGAAAGDAVLRRPDRCRRTVGSAAAALTTAGFGLVFAAVGPDAEAGGSPTTFPRVPVPRVPAVESVEVDEVRAAVVSADPDEPVVVLVCGPPELLIAVSPGGFSGRRCRLGASFVADNAVFLDDVSDDVESECPDELDADESPDDEPLPESAGAANATAGVLATAIPTPSATARAHMPPMCFAFSMGGFPSLTRAASTGRW